jgi:hypothetical protein
MPTKHGTPLSEEAIDEALRSSIYGLPPARRVCSATRLRKEESAHLPLQAEAPGTLGDTASPMYAAQSGP